MTEIIEQIARDLGGVWFDGEPEAVVSNYPGQTAAMREKYRAMARDVIAIEEFFLKSGKFELEIEPEGRPNVIGGRWLFNSDSNYGFRPVDLLAAIRQGDGAT